MYNLSYLLAMCANGHFDLSRWHEDEQFGNRTYVKRCFETAFSEDDPTVNADVLQKDRPEFFYIGIPVFLKLLELHIADIDVTNEDVIIIYEGKLHSLEKMRELFPLGDLAK